MTGGSGHNGAAARNAANATTAARNAANATTAARNAANATTAARNAANATNGGGRALAVFSGKADLGWLRLLRPGFRHCFVALEEAGRWITVDPLAGYTDVAVQPVPAAFDLAGFYRERGFTVVETRRRRRFRPAPLLPATCVEVAKRVLGIASWRVLTPGQLHDFLLDNE
ncbi:MAG: hypothetical protein OXG99_01785 [Alphaproteobacteria bacterium]|nr:hypothetical protein [Alphaproteobacteria bacterium]